jgi:hypothetical protein
MTKKTLNPIAQRISRSQLGLLLQILLVVAAASSSEPAQSQSVSHGMALPLTVLARAAQAIGIRQCYSAIAEVSSRVSANSQRQDVVLDWDRSNPDKAPFFSMTGFNNRDVSTLLSLTTIPDNVGKCVVFAEQISVSPTSCGNVADAALLGYQGKRLVPFVTVYTIASRPRETVTLVDTAGACLVVRRQVEFQWPADTARSSGQ